MAQLKRQRIEKKLTNKPDLAKQKLYTEKRTINSEKQKQLNELLLKAAMEGKIKRVERLLKAGAEAGSKYKNDMTALMFATGNNKTEMAKILIDHGADVNLAIEKGEWKGYTTLIMAAGLGSSIKIIKLLIVAGADIDTTMNDDGVTALIIARKNNHEKIAAFLQNITDLHESLGKENFKEFLSNFKECVSS